MDHFFTAEIAVCTAGYTIIGNSLSLFAVGQDDQRDYRYYNPLNTAPNLYLDFVGLDFENQSLIEFANQYGMPTPASSALGKAGGGLSRDLNLMWDNAAASIAQIKQLSQHLACCLKLWKWSRESDSQLNNLFFWKGGNTHFDTVASDYDYGRRVPRYSMPIVAEAGEVAEGNVDAAAGRALQYMVNDGLRRSCSIRIVSRNNRERLAPVLYNLAAVMWLQLGIAITESRDLKACEECGRVFEVSPDCYRGHKRFCNDACRIRTFRKRKVQAMKLRAEGAKLREIAKAVGSDTATVKKWLGE